MPLILGPSGNTLLLAPGGGLADSINCCCGLCECCEDITCGQDTVHLPACGEFPVRYIGFTADVNMTPCQQTCIMCGSPHKAIGLGNNANISRTGKKLTCASTDPNDVIIPSPEALCEHASRCRVWQSCALPTDTITGLQIARYTDIGVFNCTGNFNFYNTGTLLINLAYDHANLRFILAIWLGAGAGGEATGLLFLGTHAFDARNLASYSAFPLTFTNALGSCTCPCPGGLVERIFATGGTVTLHLYETCQEECPTSLNGESEESEASPAPTAVPNPSPTPTAANTRQIAGASGPPIAPHRFDDATAMDLADAREEQRRRCNGCRHQRGSA